MLRGRSRLERLALSVLLIGAAPLLAVVLLQKLGVVSADANPMGLGLLFVVAVPLAAVLAIAAGIVAAVKRQRH